MNTDANIRHDSMTSYRRHRACHSRCASLQENSN